MTIREQIEEQEIQSLSKKACLSRYSKGRVHPEDECDLRTVFMRDRDRVLHSEAFRRLKHKTQVFLATGNDLYRTRLTHTLQVGGIARTIARALNLNEVLTEAITYGHDLGHPPFGHAGEFALNELYPNGFKHQVQSLRIVDRIEKGKGLNLTFEVRDGILKHSKGMKSMLPDNDKELAATLEGQIMRFADRITYLNHDIDDAVRSRMLNDKDIPKELTDILGDRYSTRIHNMVMDVIQSSDNQINMSKDVLEATDQLKNFMYERVYTHPDIEDETRKGKNVIGDLYNFFLKHPEIVIEKTNFINYSDNDSIERRIVDYISMMTDVYAIKTHQKYLIPKKWFKLERD